MNYDKTVVVCKLGVGLFVHFHLGVLYDVTAPVLEGTDRRGHGCRVRRLESRLRSALMGMRGEGTLCAVVWACPELNLGF